MKKIITVSIFLLCAAGSPKAFAQKTPGFKATLTKHLNAITSKKLADIAATVSDSVFLIFPDGEVLQSKEKFVAMHADWFKDSLWKMTTEILNCNESNTLGFANVRYHYKKYHPDGSALSDSDTYLLLIFKKEKEGWKLIHDQNTKITR